MMSIIGTTRRPSLERQITLYDEQGGGTSGDVTSRENRYSNYHSYYHQYSTSQEEPRYVSESSSSWQHEAGRSGWVRLTNGGSCQGSEGRMICHSL